MKNTMNIPIAKLYEYNIMFFIQVTISYDNNLLFRINTSAWKSKILITQWSNQSKISLLDGVLWSVHTLPCLRQPYNGSDTATRVHFNNDIAKEFIFNHTQFNRELQQSDFIKQFIIFILINQLYQNTGFVQLCQQQQ